MYVFTMCTFCTEKLNVEQIFFIAITFQVNQAGRDGGTPLHQAIIGGIVCSLLSFRKHSFSIVDKIYTFALSTGHKRTIELLLEKGAHINAVENNWQMTPLHFLVVLADWNEDDKLRNSTISVPFTSAAIKSIFFLTHRICKAIDRPWS